MTLALPSDADTYNVLGAWDTSIQYRGTGDQAKADMVAYLGAWWYSTFYTIGVLPVNGGGSGWALDPNGPAPNYSPVVPDAPTDLHAGYKSANAVSLFWDVPMVEGEGTVTGYNIYQDGSLVGTSTINAFTVTGLQAHHNYSFTIEALDQTGASGNYEFISPFGVDQNPDPMDNPSIAIRTEGTDNLSGKYFSPYVDMTLPSTNILNISGDTGLRDFTLAFSQTNFKNIAGTAFDDYGHPTAGAYDSHSGAPTLAWGGIENTIQPTGAIINQVKAVEAEGGTVTISIGGYTGFDPAVIATQYADSLAGSMSVAKANAKAVANLTQEYQSLLTTYGVHSLDFDIENATTVNNTRANHMRNLAIKALEDANPDLKVTFTLATTSHGLSKDVNSGSGDDYNVLFQAHKDGVHIDVVNIMAMDYYDGNTAAAAQFIRPDGTYNMLRAAEVAATQVNAQLHGRLHMDDTLVGITPMIGQNDDYGQAPYDGVQEFFSLRDAQMLEHWAEGKSWVAGLGEWALPRDRAGDAESGPTSPNDLGPEHSGAAQTDWQFAHILNQITKGPVGSGAPVAMAATLMSASSDAHLSAAFVHAPDAGVDMAAGHDLHGRADLAMTNLDHLVCLV